MNSLDVLAQPKRYSWKNTSPLPYINLSLLLWTFLNLICLSCIPLGKPTALTENPPSPSATLGARFPFNFSTPSANTLAQVGMNKHCQSIWEKTWIISQLRVSLCFPSRSVAFAILILLVSPLERSLLLINYLVRLDHSTPRQFLFMLFSYTWQASRRAKLSGKHKKSHSHCSFLSSCIYCSMFTQNQLHLSTLLLIALQLWYTGLQHGSYFVLECSRYFLPLWFCTLWHCAQCLSFKSSQ